MGRGHDNNSAASGATMRAGESVDLQPFSATIEFKLFPRKGEPEKPDGFTIAKAVHADNGREVTLKGPFGPCVEGQTIKVLKYKWESDPRYGSYCKVIEIDHSDPTDLADMADFVAAIGSVSKTTANTIVETLGDDALKQIDADPLILLEIKSTTDGYPIDLKEIETLAKDWPVKREQRKALSELMEMGLTNYAATRAVESLGTNWKDVKDNPYLLTYVQGVGFRTAEQVGIKQGIPANDIRRLGAGMEHVLMSAENDGHICMTREQIFGVAPGLLARDGYIPGFTEIDNAIEKMIEHGRLWAEINDVDGIERVYTTEHYLIETRLYGFIQERMTRKNTSLAIAPSSPPENSLATAEQWSCVQNCYDSKLSILTGGPGTGKTTTLNELLDQLDRDGLSYVCMAPTGKAAKRMRESTGREATTIHMKLGKDGVAPPSTLHDGPAPSGNEDSPYKLNESVIIIDEASMLDMRIAERVFTTADPESHVVLVGDPYQLPAVGAGSVLYDLIESDRVPMTNLTQIFRQAENSLLTVNAHRIKEGKEPYWSVSEAEEALGHELNEDWKFIETDGAKESLDLTVGLRDNLKKELDVTSDEVLITAPTKRGDIGTWILNRVVQDIENPNGEQIRSGDQPLRFGDRVMNIKNRYARQRGEASVMNGDIGTIVGFEEKEEVPKGSPKGTAPVRNIKVDVKFDEKIETYSKYDLKDLIPAYASTTHKLQGSEAPAIIAPVVGGSTGSRMLTRNLLYTAWTRASKKCVVVGDKKTIIEALANDGTKRESTLDLRVGAIERKLEGRTSTLDTDSE